MPKTENINQLIETIASQPAKLLRMADYTTVIECGTAHCVGGWVRVIASKPDDPWMDDRQRADWLGITLDELHDVEFMPERSLGWFDRQPAEQRQAAALAMLETLRDTGAVDWEGALQKAGLIMEGE